MAREPKQFTLEDDYGEEHEYIITQHGAEKGVELLPEIMKFLAEGIGPIVDIVVDNLDAITPAKERDEIRDQLSAGDLEEMDDLSNLADADVSLEDLRIDGQTVKDAISGLAQKIVESGSVGFFKDLLSHTKRRMSGELVSADDKFDIIYQGNYGELAIVLGKVIEFNFGKSLSRVLSGE